MSPTVTKVLAVIAVVAPIVIDAIMKFKAGQMVDWNLVVSTIVGALGGSQLIARKGDVDPKKHEAALSKAADQGYTLGLQDAAHAARASQTPPE